ncbi:MAG: ABC transporter ATP-binding protein [Planctomycetota bacterium]|jgi:putative ABC transport system ATP-binding protein
MTQPPRPEASPAPILQAEGLSLEYRDGDRRVRAVDGIDLRLSRGEFMGLVGPSGSGKSSLLFLLAGLRAPDAGRVRVNGIELPRKPDLGADIRRRHVGFLFQEPFLVPYLSVRENALAHTSDPEASARLDALAAEIGMSSLLDERPHRLSGGERQRAGILRALAHAPDLVLADEPTANLDQATGHAVMDALRNHAQQSALLVVTHDEGMLRGAGRILRLRDGRVRTP